MNTGKYFESQFVKSFHRLFNPPEWYIIRLKDTGKIKTVDVGDYLVFHKNIVFNVELKARENGVIYPSEIKTEYMENQLYKWRSFEYLPYRIPLYILKNEKTKEIGVFLSKDINEELKNEEIKEIDAPIKIEFYNSDIPYDLRILFDKVETYLKSV
jgi:protein associated with RNAse G/E